jgi:DNA-binding phage protein
MNVTKQIEQLIKEAGGVMPLASNTGVPRQTIYNLRDGGWPSAKVASKLKLKIVREAAKA